MKLNKGNVSLGLDIGSHYLKLVELREQGDNIELSKCQVEELPHDAIVDKQIMDREIVVQKLQDLLKNGNLKNKEVMISVAGRGVIIKKIVTDKMNDAELEDAIEWEARQHIPYDISEVSLDFQRLPQGETETDHTDVLLVAAKNDLVNSGSDLTRLAGLMPIGIDLDAFAVQNALHQNNYIPEEGTIAVLHIGFTNTNVSVIVDGVFDTNRDLPVAGKMFLEHIVRRLGIPIKEGFNLLWKGAPEGPIAEVLDETIRSTAEKLVETMERAFPQYCSASAPNPITKVILCGGGALFPGLKESLMEHMALPVEIADPLKQISPNGAVPEDIGKKLAPSLTLAIGLALEGLGIPEDRVQFNLLPAEERTKKRYNYLGNQQIAIPAALGAIFLVGATLQTVHQNDIIRELRDEVAILEKESEMFREKIDLVEEFTTKRNDIMARVNIIEDLDRDRFLRVHFLDELNKLLPSLTWLQAIREATAQPGFATIEGVTTNNLKVSEFMSNLIASDLFESVDLAVSQQKEIAHQNITTFNIQVKLKGAFQAEEHTTDQTENTPKPGK
jgi:type IV pilus assembly protein PilM